MSKFFFEMAKLVVDGCHYTVLSNTTVFFFTFFKHNVVGISLFHYYLGTETFAVLRASENVNLMLQCLHQLTCLAFCSFFCSMCS